MNHAEPGIVSSPPYGTSCMSPFLSPHAVVAKWQSQQHLDATQDCHIIFKSLSKLPGADTAHYLENECMRQAMEGLLYTYGVNVIFNGHLHVYERTFPMYVSHQLA